MKYCMQLDSPIWFYTHESWWNPWIAEDIEKLNILHVFSYFKHVITHEFQFSAPTGFNCNIIIIFEALFNASNSSTFLSLNFFESRFVKVQQCQNFQFYDIVVEKFVWYGNHSKIMSQYCYITGIPPTTNYH